MLYFKPFEQIEISDIELLKSEGTTEGRFLEFKEEPPRDARGFLETVVAFANSQGGVIVYGVTEQRVGSEKTGKIGEVCGFDGEAIDSLKARFENFIRDQIQPRIEYRLKELSLPNGKNLLIVRVNQGWRGPYFFRFQRGLLFYRRAESQNVLMDHPEIKTSFLSGDTARDRLVRFAEKRTQDIVSQQMPFSMEGERSLIVHVLPLDSFRDDVTFSHEGLNRYVASVGPISSQSYSARPNVDGVFQYWSHKNEHAKPISYAQYFRNGSIEYADSFILGSVAGEMRVHIKPFGDKFGHSIRRAVAYQKSLGLSGPFYVGVSLWNVKGMKLMQGNEPWESDDSMRFDREHIKLPLFQIDDSNINEPFVLMRPMIEMICQAAGWEKCHRYQTDGTWV